MLCIMLHMTRLTQQLGKQEVPVLMDQEGTLLTGGVKAFASTPGASPVIVLTSSGSCRTSQSQ